MMSFWFALVCLLVVGGYLWLIGRRLKNLETRLDRINDRLYAWGGESRKAYENLEGRLKELEFEERKKSGKIRISGDLLISDLLEIHPRMAEVLAGFHLGGCSSCRISRTETLAQAASSYGLDLESIVAEIERFLENPTVYQPPSPDPTQQTLQIRIPQRSPEQFRFGD